MRYRIGLVIVATLASSIAVANTTNANMQSPAAASEHRAATSSHHSATTMPAAESHCHALDAAARHECIYAAIARSRAAQGATIN